MAMFLSSLRVFSHLATQGSDSRRIQDSALHVLHALTRFPPAIRAMYILLSGNATTPEECAALIQSLHEIMVDMLSSSAFATQKTRTLESSRLFFGMLLGKSKSLMLDLNNNLGLPYMASMNVTTLVNSETMEPIAFPVDTRIGLLEKGCFDALKAGIIQFTDPDLNESLTEVSLRSQVSRAAFLSGGLLSSITMFDLNSLASNYRYENGDASDTILTSEDLSDIIQHAVTCAAVKMSVVPPASLGSSPSSVLTLDRDGLAAVYLGRKACGSPGQDFLIFRPTKGGECDIDVSVVTQLLEPILAARVADGSAIFDGVGEAIKRKSDKPSEILMICVDCSSSMSKSAGFNDNEVEDDDVEKSAEEILLQDIRENEIHFGTIDDAKETLQNHESFQDIVYAVKACRGTIQKATAALLLQRLSDLKISELQQWMSKLELLQGNVHWLAHGRRRDREVAESEVQERRSFIASLAHHQPALVEFLLYRACCISDTNGSESWRWTIGQEIPNSSTSRNDSSDIQLVSTDLSLTVPPELCCPMTQELFDDPVKTVDGHTYEQSAIRKWFQTMETSPLTGLPLSSTSLTTNRNVLLGIRDWVDGKDILSEYITSPRTRRGTGQMPDSIKLSFTSRQSPFQRRVPRSLASKLLYEIAFKALKGRYPRFNLLFNGSVISPNDSPIFALGLVEASQVVIRLPDITPGFGSLVGGRISHDARADMCLVKVYEDIKVPLFSYWTQGSSKDTIASIMFKVWRHKAESSRHPALESLELWHSVADKGDDFFTGYKISNWDKLSEYLNPFYAKGVLSAEPLYHLEESDEEVRSIHGDSPSVVDSLHSEDDDVPTIRAPALVLKLYLNKPGRKRKRTDRKLTTSRLSLLKQMFDQFVNRILAYNYSTHLGLITFSTSARVVQRITHVVENFRSSVQVLEHHGDTALWDALALARDQIQQYAATYPEAKKRILCISDGIDTKSHRAGQEMCQTLSLDGIVVDSFCLGGEQNQDLRALSYMTNGFKFHPTSLDQAMAICEMEPVLNQLERDLDSIVTTRQASLSHATTIDTRFMRAKWEAKPEVVTQDVFPKRKEHPSLADNFVELKAVSRRDLAGQRGSNVSPSYMRTYRILSEMQRIAANPHPHYDVYVSERNMSFWKVVVQGPPGSVYAGGTFELYLDMDESYPGFAPKARFVTPIYHPNVNRHGRICHSIFDRNWTTDTSTAMVLSTVYGLLLQPDYSDPV
jgi:ubiquitin-protein ligase/uncharacterized protein YegL